MNEEAVVNNADLPWQDQWHKPTRQQLFEPWNQQHSKALENLLAKVEAYDHLSSQIQWHGQGWFWTIEYNVSSPDGEPLETLIYVIPNGHHPVICVPLSHKMFEALPIRRLHKYVRTGVRGAKRTVDVHWAEFQLTASSEAEQLIELIKRKYKYLMEPFKPKKKGK